MILFMVRFCELYKELKLKDKRKESLSSVFLKLCKVQLVDNSRRKTKDLIW